MSTDTADEFLAVYTQYSSLTQSFTMLLELADVFAAFCGHANRLGKHRLDKYTHTNTDTDTDTTEHTFKHRHHLRPRVHASVHVVPLCINSPFAWVSR